VLEPVVEGKVENWDKPKTVPLDRGRRPEAPKKMLSPSGRMPRTARATGTADLAAPEGFWGIAELPAATAEAAPIPRPRGSRAGGGSKAATGGAPRTNARRRMEG
jgi:hypothetical protein